MDMKMSGHEDRIKIAAKESDIKLDTKTDAYREWKLMLDDVSQRVAGKFAAINYGAIEQLAKINANKKGNASELDEMFSNEKGGESATHGIRR